MMKFGFIGIGNMGGALASAVCRAGNAADVAVADHDKKKTKIFADVYGATVADNVTVASECKYIFLGVKPQMMEALLHEISPTLRERRNDKFILVTMAAGLSVSTIEYLCDRAFPVIRIMPNTPASVGEGMILMTSNEYVTAEELDEFAEALSLAGKVEQIKEKYIDAASVISGCGPAFMYLFLESLVKAGEKLGLDEEAARLYAEQTMRGAATLAMSSNTSLEQLRINVCSPGGSTIEGVKVFQSSDLDDTVYRALEASYKRTKELAKGQ